MSVYIKGMEMPTNCKRCEFFTPFQNGFVMIGPLGHCDRLGKEIFYLENRLEDCPLIPVPPHGRLIVLPVEIGTELYWVRSWGELCVEVGCVSMLQQKANKSWKIRISNSGSCFDVEQAEIGKSIFLTREEAEVALNEKTAKYQRALGTCGVSGNHPSN